MSKESQDNWTHNALQDAQDWDADFAEELLGSTLLVGLTYLDADGAFLLRKQAFGRIEIVCPEEGIGVRLADDEDLLMIPPMLDAVDYAAPGIYHLKNAGVSIENPDFVASFNVTGPSLS